MRIENKTFDEIRIGDCAQMQPTLTKEDIDVFGVLSSDMNPTHFSAKSMPGCCLTATRW